MAKKKPATIRHTLTSIKAALRDGLHPKKFGGRYLGSGCFKVVYKVGDYVVKKCSASDDFADREYNEAHARLTFPRVLLKYGLRRAREWRYKGWIIQPYYKPLTQEQYDKRMHRRFANNWHDIKEHNVGVGKDGYIYAFDWL